MYTSYVSSVSSPQQCQLCVTLSPQVKEMDPAEWSALETFLQLKAPLSVWACELCQGLLELLATLRKVLQYNVELTWRLQTTSQESVNSGQNLSSLMIELQGALTSFSDRAKRARNPRAVRVLLDRAEVARYLAQYNQGSPARQTQTVLSAGVSEYHNIKQENSKPLAPSSEVSDPPAPSPMDSPDVSLAGSPFPAEEQDAAGELSPENKFEISESALSPWTRDSPTQEPLSEWWTHKQEADLDESLYWCFKCNKSFLSSINLKNHLKICVAHTSSCEICGKKFVSKKSLIWHIMHVHLHWVRCDICKSKFGSKLQLQRHMVSMHLPQQLKGSQMCELCSRVLPSSKHLAQHLRAHARDLKCPLCFYADRDTLALKRHIFREHTMPALEQASTLQVQATTSCAGDEQEEVLLLECEFCSARLVGEAALEAHVATHLQDTVTQEAEQARQARQLWETEAIEVTPGTQSDAIDSELRSFLLQPDAPPLLPFPCGECEVTLSSRRELSYHYTDLHPGLTRFKCRLCTFTTANISSFCHHMAVHAANCKYRCPFCPMVVTEKRYLHEHMGGAWPPGVTAEKCRVFLDAQKSHGPTDCPFCENTYSKSNNRDKHIRNYHPEQLLPCGSCSKVFFYLCKLRKHRAAKHKTFACSYCQVSSSTERALQQHVREMHGDRPAFWCRICALGYPTARQYATHVTYHQDERLVSHAVAEPDRWDGDSRPKHIVFDLSPDQLADPCDRCKALSGTELKIHVATVHLNFPAILCKKCGKVYVSMSTAQEHLNLKHSVPRKSTPCTRFQARTTQNKLRCEECNKTFYRRNIFLFHTLLTEHCKICSKSVRKTKIEAHLKYCKTCTFKCSQCKFRFKTKRGRREHVSNYHSVQKYLQNTCAHCPASRLCDELYTWRRHYTNLHRGLKPLAYCCTACTFSCDSVMEFRQHASRRHERALAHCASCRRDVVSLQRHIECCLAGASEATCSLCGERRGRSEMAQHLEQHGRGQRLRCDLCFNFFPSQCNLQLHRSHCHLPAPLRDADGVTETTELYTCALCGVRMSYKMDLRAHLLLHGTPQPNCVVCGVSQKSPSSLQRHVMQKHEFLIPWEIREALRTCDPGKEH